MHEVMCLKARVDISHAKDNHVKTLYMKFYCQILHNHSHIYVSKYFNLPP